MPRPQHQPPRLPHRPRPRGQRPLPSRPQPQPPRRRRPRLHARARPPARRLRTVHSLRPGTIAGCGSVSAASVAFVSCPGGPNALNRPVIQACSRRPVSLAVQAASISAFRRRSTTARPASDPARRWRTAQVWRANAKRWPAFSIPRSAPVVVRWWRILMRMDAHVPTNAGHVLRWMNGAAFRMEPVRTGPVPRDHAPTHVRPRRASSAASSRRTDVICPPDPVAPGSQVGVAAASVPAASVRRPG